MHVIFIGMIMMWYWLIIGALAKAPAKRSENEMLNDMQFVYNSAENAICGNIT